MKRMEGKVVLVTGGGSGIGKATCELLAKEGAKVIVTGRTESTIEETVKDIISVGGEAVAVKHDVSSEGDWKKLMAYISEKFNKLDVLVNNAAVGISRAISEVSLEDWQKIQNINLDGVFLGVRSAIDLMSEKNKDSDCSIINISSIYGLVGTGGRTADECFRPSTFQSAYSASKGGVTVFTKSAAVECARLGLNIRVNSIHPGFVMIGRNRPLNEEGKRALDIYQGLVPMGRYAEPIEIAKGVLFLASDESSYMTGSELVIDGGITAV